MQVSHRWSHPPFEAVPQAETPLSNSLPILYGFRDPNGLKSVSEPWARWFWAEALLNLWPQETLLWEVWRTYRQLKLLLEKRGDICWGFYCF